MRFLKAFVYATSGLFLLVGAMHNALSDTFSEVKTNHAAELPLTLLGLGLCVATMYEFVQGITETAEKQKAKREAQRR